MCSLLVTNALPHCPSARYADGDMTRVILTLLIFSLMVALGCSSDKNPGGDDGDELHTLNENEKLQAMSVFAPWGTLREALEIVAEPSRDPAAGPEVRKIAEELRSLCVVQKSAPTVEALTAQPGERVESVVVGPSADKPDCPVQFRSVFTFNRLQTGNETLAHGQLEIQYEARSERAQDLSSIGSLQLKGTVHSATTSRRNGEIRDEWREALSGSLQTSAKKPIPVSSNIQIQTRFRGAMVKTVKVEVRNAQIGNMSTELRIERYKGDNNVVTERHFINRQTISVDEYEKLRREAQKPQSPSM